MTAGHMVVLGPTGRNFGAGMSGGVAFVWDPNGLFPALLNREMVDLDPLTDDDRAFLRVTVETHVRETESDVGSRLLANWAHSVEQFAKVMPQDYKRVLRAAAAAEAEGRDVNDAIMAASRA